MGTTIVAIATPPFESAIGIIRISGPDTFKILKNIFQTKNFSFYDENNIKSHTIFHGYIKDENKIYDEVLVSIFKSPTSYTGEDMAEINVHGNPFILNKVINLLLKHGAILAEPGEFTKRAFLNGKIDLSQAEAVLDVIKARNDVALNLSLNQLKGKEKNIISDLRSKIEKILTLIETNIEFSETDAIKIDTNSFISSLIEILKKIEKLIKNADAGINLKDGFSLVITGKPNSGKSSLLNVLLNKEKAIVTHIPGTTRDIIEDKILIEGLPFKIIDTAGLRDTEDLIEKEGIKRTKDALNTATLILFLIDGSKNLSAEDKKIFEHIKDKNFLYVINKSDLPLKIKEIDIFNFFKTKQDIIFISALKKQKIKDLTNLIKQNIMKIKNFNSFDDIVITNLRHKNALIKSKSHIENATKMIKNKNYIEIISEEIKEALENIKEIVGEISSEDILNNIFSNFCIGK